MGKPVKTSPAGIGANSHSSVSCMAAGSAGEISINRGAQSSSLPGQGLTRFDQQISNSFRHRVGQSVSANAQMVGSEVYFSCI
ncbi:hypothetical protein BO86DRAFT_186523 [Aspergillus japonicus CBS 114.51]|uniref:Uncharacterized protein n=1 Tax=Aspergillus japonicus CBS 114.51 TaxID=1448312 RepID=A0A8T8XB85_ASPJA|nr:hypothetical protein BO86DRAFT_186523 [Aspergillus japonicus CBS 114.51]RAH85250.1 hypothetical protein BO86DRAFT_186523 [Aspergillus japonicus CBS 114.51]